MESLWVRTNATPSGSRCDRAGIWNSAVRVGPRSSNRNAGGRTEPTQVTFNTPKKSSLGSPPLCSSNVRVCFHTMRSVSTVRNTFWKSSLSILFRLLHYPLPRFPVPRFQRPPFNHFSDVHVRYNVVVRPFVLCARIYARRESIVLCSTCIDVVVKQFTFAISSPDELLVLIGRIQICCCYCCCLESISINYLRKLLSTFLIL